MKENKNNRKPLIALALLAVIGIVGGTIAYFTSVAEFDNVFQTAKYQTTVTEEFVSPDNWTPGTTTAKKVVAKNEGTIPVAVRVSYTESWVDANGGTLALTKDEESVAQINFANTADWTKEGNYYYYNKQLAAGATTSSFIESVTFNPNITMDVTCTTSADGLSKTCTTGGYAGATYTLKIKVETVQFDQYKTVWTTNVTIN